MSTISIAITVAVMLGSLSGLAYAAPAVLGTERVSVDSSGVQGNGQSTVPAVSADGRFVAFMSYASNLVASDTNDQRDIFVRDRQTGATTRVSVSSTGEQGNGGSDSPAISADGRFVAFTSYASNLVASDTNDYNDVFLHDRQTGMTTRVSVDSAGAEGSGDSCFPDISPDGQFVTFESRADNLATSDKDTIGDVFVHHVQSGTTTLVSVDSSGAKGDSDSSSPEISADGRFVTFYSNATNLVASDTNRELDVFVHDRQTGMTTRVSVDSSGAQGDNLSCGSAISADGRFVAFGSLATNLVASDTNVAWDVFVHDRQTGTTTLVSVDSSGVQGNDGSEYPSLSSDGRFVAFTSGATNLVASDTNGAGDVFMHDRQTGSTTRVSVGLAGVQADLQSEGAAISADDRFVTFYSNATNLVASDTNGEGDVFVVTYGEPTPPVVIVTPSSSGVSLSRPITPWSVRRNRNFTVYGWMSAWHTKRTYPVTLYCYRLRGDQWVLVKTARMRAYQMRWRTKYAGRLKLPYKGTWRLVAVHQDAGFAPDYSPPRFMRVR